MLVGEVDVVNETPRGQFVPAVSPGRCSVYSWMAGCNQLHSDKVLGFCPSCADLETYRRWLHGRVLHSLSTSWRYFSVVTFVTETLMHSLSLSFSYAPGGNRYLRSLLAAALGKGWLQPACAPCCPSQRPAQLSIRHKGRPAVRLGWEETAEGGSQRSRKVPQTWEGAVPPALASSSTAPENCARYLQVWKNQICGKKERHAPSTSPWTVFPGRFIALWSLVELWHLFGSTVKESRGVADPHREHRAVKYPNMLLNPEFPGGVPKFRRCQQEL